MNKYSWPAPPHEDAFYGLAGEIVLAIEPHSEADSVALLIQLLVSVGSMVGRTCYFTAQSHRHHCNLFSVIVGDTAKARKGSSWGPISHIVSQVDKEWSENRIVSGLSSGEGFIWQIRDPLLMPGGSPDAGVSDKRLLIIEEEFASVLKVVKREGNTLSPYIRSAWDGKSLKSLTKSNPISVTLPHVSTIGHITTEELKKCLTETESANGFGNRFLWFCVKRSKFLPDGGAFHEEDIDHLVRALKSAVDFAKEVGQMGRDQEASRLWHEIYGPLSEGRSGLLGFMTGRREAQVMRLALLHALLDESKEIKKCHLRAALALERYSFDSCRHIFGDATGDVTADAIWMALQERKVGLTRAEISRNLFQRNKSQADVDRALFLLETTGRATRKFEPTGGRTAERWCSL